MNTRAKKVMETLGNWFLVNCIIFFVWMLLSVIDIASHNLSPDPVYPWWNLIIVLINMAA